MFPSGLGSHYIYICYLDGVPPPPSTQGVQATVNEVVQAWEQARA
jgi:hypothetical protein